MRTRKLIGALLTAGVCVGAYHWIKEKCCDKTKLHFCKPANTATGEYWTYTLSRPDVLREEHCMTIAVAGPCCIQKWVFASVNPGAVTICWTKMIGNAPSDETEIDVIQVNAKGEIHFAKAGLENSF